MISDGLTVGFHVTEDDSPLERATGRTSTTVDCIPPPQLRYDGNVLIRVHIRDTGDSLAEVLHEDERTSHVFHSQSHEGSTIRCLSSEPSSLHALTNAGFLPTTVRYSDGTGFFRGEVVGRDVLKNVLQAAGSTVGVRVSDIYHIDPDGDSVFPDSESPQGWDLTPAQEEALETAYRLGYFEIPREATSADIATELGISESAYLQRMQRAERRVVEKIFDGEFHP